MDNKIIKKTWKINVEKKANKHHNVACLSKGEYFGEQEILSNSPRTTNAICMSSYCDLYLIKRELYLEMMFIFSKTTP